MILSLIVIVLLSACRNDFDFEEHYSGGEIKKEYADNWVDQFGKIDPQQTWNLAEQGAVTVSVDTESEVRVYAKEGNMYHIVADYQDVVGTQTLTFDVKKGISDIYVTDGTNGAYAKIGDEVSLGSVTRGGYNGPTVHDCRVEITDEIVILDKNTIKSIVTALPEGQNNTSKSETSKFTVVAKNDYITINLPYYSSNQICVFGIYFVNNPSNLIPIYKNQDSGDFSAKVLAYSLDPNYNISEFGNDTKWPRRISGSQFIDTNWLNNSQSLVVGSKTIKVYVGKGSEVGFYTYFGNKTNQSEVAGHFAQVTIGDKTYVGLEDGKDSDMNDYMFTVGNTEILDKTTQSWIIACEDLGDTGDYDFNDLVFKVEHTSGASTATITPLAAGGTLEANFSLDGSNWYEIHGCFGKTGYESGKYPMINTMSRTNGVDGLKAQAKSFAVPPKFSLAPTTGNITAGINNNMGGFTIKVKHKDNTMSNVVEITAPASGEAPQMILVPNGWYWPRERVSIYDAYPGFKSWNGDVTISDWFIKASFDELVTH